MFRFLLIATGLLCLQNVNAQTSARALDLNIIPKPVSMKLSPGTFRITKNTPLVIGNPGDKDAVDFFNDYLEKYYGFKLPLSGSATGNYIAVTTTKGGDSASEKYSLTVTSNSVLLKGETVDGTFRGIQSLIQLLPLTKSAQLMIPLVSITDEPRFRYRGLHLDVGRHFFDVNDVKKYIDYIALHKMNYFHWHLTEDQGWRIEIKKYPRLTEIGGWRDGTIIGHHPGTGNDGIRYGGFYTQDEIREVVAYATRRHITVIPEIEMPGHAGAALASYSYLGCTGGPYKVKESWGVHEDVFCAGNDSVFSFLQDVLDEVMPLFPAAYIHIGGDECPKDSWKKCPKCQQRIKDNNLKDEHGLQSYFIQRMEKYINGKGKKIIGWDEILEGGLAPNATVMSWRGEEGGIEAAKQKHNVIMTPGDYVYFDHAQKRNDDSLTIGGYLNMQTVYGYNPEPVQLDAGQHQYIMGAQANLWTEYIANFSKLQYMLFPRMAALSEVLWSPQSAR
ncbi:MAG TPA: beta-N-acetylhexosaminidase, partial [Flavitalea sp.]|nr:beta-N-acetylhexosaminidase [Flavitalea sp.]